jgi:hypothetical protein
VGCVSRRDAEVMGDEQERQVLVVIERHEQLEKCIFGR